MPFRRPDALASLRERFIANEINPLPAGLRPAGHRALQSVEELVGPPVGTLPAWHPLLFGLAKHARRYSHWGQVSESDLYDIFDHADYDHPTMFAEGILCTSYNPKAAERMRSVLHRLLPAGERDHYTVEEVEGHLHAEDATLVLLRHCYWEYHSQVSQYNAKAQLRWALLFLADNTWTDCAETWATMRSTMLGSPCGAVSSAYVEEPLGKRLKILLKALNAAEYHGAVNHNTHFGFMDGAPPYKRKVSRWHPEETAMREDKAEKEWERARKASQRSPGK